MFFHHISLESHGQTDFVYLAGGKNNYGCAYDLCFSAISPAEDRHTLPRDLQGLFVAVAQCG